MKAQCIWCKRNGLFKRERGWVHKDGEGLYWMKCLDCGWEGSSFPSPIICPQCGSKNIRDDHCFLAES